MTWSGPDSMTMGRSGVNREIAPPPRMVHAERFDEDWTDGETAVTTGLTAGKTGPRGRR